MAFYLGCAVWSYKGWVGDFYPPKSPPSDFLTLYSQRLTAVEGNTTFYAVPGETTVNRWVNQTPPGFKFCLKFPKTLTHQGLLSPQVPQAINFLKRVQPLGDRLGPVFAQLPPTYSPEFLEDLSQFFHTLTQEIPQIRFAVEVRHRDWFEPHQEKSLNDCLETLQIGRVLLDTRPIYNTDETTPVPQSRRKPQLPLQPCVTTDFSLIRFISHPQAQYNIQYLETWVTQVNSWLTQGVDLYFFVHCPVEERSPFTARDFQHQLKQHQVPIPLLPWDNLSPPPQQLSLF